MINIDPNMGRKQIFDELPLPDKIEEKENFLFYLYKGVFICVKLLLDIRLNLVKMSEGKQISTRHTEVKQPNPVIKDTDKLK